MYVKFKKMTKINIELEYKELVDRISCEAVLEFTQARENIEEMRKACCQYFKRGIQEGLSQGELIDFLGISTPSILSLSGYTEEEESEIMELLG